MQLRLSELEFSGRIARYYKSFVPARRRDAVLVTGFCSGLDYELACLFGEQGRDVVLCSPNTSRLSYALDRIRSHCPDSRIEQVAIGLADTDGPAKLRDAVEQLGLRIGLVAANFADGEAGVPVFRPFLHDMARRGRGGILISVSMPEDASMSSAHDRAATDAAALDLAMSLWKEWKHRGIVVSALLAGAAEPMNLDTSRRYGRRHGDAAHLAAKAYKALLEGNAKVFTSMTATRTDEFSAPAIQAA